MKTQKGWKLVPVEPDDMMKKEAKKCVTGTGGAGRALRSSEQIFTEQYKAALAAAPTPPAQEDEPVAEVVKFGDGPWGEIYKTYVNLPSGTKLYTRPDDKLRKLAEEYIEYMCPVADVDRSSAQIFAFLYTYEKKIRAALEGK